ITEMNGDTTLILSLINRISLKLPCNSGQQLDVLESDPLILQTVNSIIDLSRYKLSTIANNLTQLLETISRSSVVMEDFVPFDVLQSQLFILKILSACMTNHWKYYRGSQREIDNQSKATQVIPSNSQSINDPDSVSSSTTQNIPQPVKIDQKQQKLPRSWDDPPPLEDPLAKYILSVLSRFLHQYVTHEDNNLNPQTGASSGQPTRDHGLPTNPNVQVSAATHDIISEIYKNAGRVIFYISASNWHVVFSRIKN
ncbi:12204_t:CDS:2, partial [Cetraspora pellucida]